MVTKVEASTEGWGESQRAVGIDVEVSHQLLDTKLDDDGNAKVLTRKNVITLGFEQRMNVHVGDNVELTIEHIEGEEA
jgi:hypothetical protein